MRRPLALALGSCLLAAACADGTILNERSPTTTVTVGGGPTVTSSSGPSTSSGMGGADGGGGQASSGGGGSGGDATTISTGDGGAGGGDVVAPTVATVSPTDGAIAVASNAKIQVVFSEPMDPATVTAAPSASCSGSIQVSNDDFASCVPITGGAVTLDDTSFTLTTSAPLASLGQYRIRVTTAVEDAAGNPLGATFETPAGFAVAFRHTVIIDGINDFFPSDVFTASTTGAELYVTHDETDVFVGLASPDINPAGGGNKFVYFLFSVDGSLSTGNALSSDSKAKFGTSKKMTYHFKERIAGGTYSEFRIGDPSGWSTDWGTQNKVSFVANGFVEAKIALSELGGAPPSAVLVTAYTVDYDGDGGNGWVYNMLSGATDGSGAQPRDVVRYVGLDLPASLVPSDVSHVHSF